MYQGMVVVLRGHVECPPGLLLCFGQLDSSLVQLTGFQLVEMLSMFRFVVQPFLLLLLQSCPVPGERKLLSKILFTADGFDQ